MSNIPPELRYTQHHSWVKKEKDGTLIVGITDFAQSALGDIVFVQLPDEGMNYLQDQQVGIIESVKTGSDIYAPVKGKIVEVNQILNDHPALINEDPYGVWIYKMITLSDIEFEQLLTATRYSDLIAE